jgi:hypothetical protein
MIELLNENQRNNTSALRLAYGVETLENRTLQSQILVNRSPRQNGRARINSAKIQDSKRRPHHDVFLFNRVFCRLDRLLATPNSFLEHLLVDSRKHSSRNILITKDDDNNS